MTLTVTRAVLHIHGMSPDDIGQPELAPEGVRTLRLLLEAPGFDLGQPIQLPERRGFHLRE